MTRITAKSITLNHFKGVEYLNYTLGEKVFIHGDNETGKTTLCDAFLWCLFGKDSTGRSAFSIKTLDSHNIPIPKLEHTVGLLLNVNGEDQGFRRTFKEKWEKKHGAEKPEMTGHETLYFWNDVPVTQKKYKDKVNKLIDEQLFKLLTNPIYFNSLKWQDRRGILNQLVQKHTTEEVIEAMSLKETQKQIVVDLLNGSITLNERLKQNAASQKKLSDLLVKIPTRTDEVSRGIPQKLDFKHIKLRNNELISAIEQLDTQLTDKSRAMQPLIDARAKVQNEINSKETQLNALKSKIKVEVATNYISPEIEITNKTNQIKAFNTSLDKLINERLQAKTAIETLLKENKALQDDWETVNGSRLDFDGHEFVCPSCKQNLPELGIEATKQELTKNFNTNKQLKLSEIVEKGHLNGNKIVQLRKDLEVIREKGSQIKKQSTALTVDLEYLILNAKDTPSLEQKTTTAISDNIEIKRLSSEIDQAKNNIKAPIKIDNEDLKIKKAELSAELEKVKKDLAVEGTIEKANARIVELEKEQQSYTKELSRLEGIQYYLETFNRTSVELLEKSINDKFSKVKFKLFESQINGGEKECCETLINGVPYADANNAAKINSGIDIINVLSKHYDISAPIWIDNRESITKITPTTSQVISLVVDEKAKELVLK